MVRLLALIFFSLITCNAWASTEPTEKNGLNWEGWSDSIFERAQREDRFVLLDLEAVWCHWCHVMEEVTYRDPAVIKLLQSKYITVRVDQDARPDLSNRYEDYGWPATIIFTPDGKEIIKRSGYIPPPMMTSLLQAVIDDPSPGPSVQPEPDLKAVGSAFLSEDLRSKLLAAHLSHYDFKLGSWGTVHKLLDWNSVEYAMTQAKTGDKQATVMARQTLDAQLQLVDPVWGGVYQYSSSGIWTEPHFEKIMSTQAENLRIYALAYMEWRDPAYLQAARDIQRYLKTFLTSPDGALYTSQDADMTQGEHAADYFKLGDAARHKLGIPRIDTHHYARENGWAINALATLYSASGEAQYLDEAIKAAQWIIANRALPEGGFSHDAKDPAGPYLGDTLAMGRAFLTLYTATGDRQWLARAEAAAQFMANNFIDKTLPGFITAKTPTDKAYSPRPQREENILATRFTNLLFHYTGNQAYRAMAEQGMRFLALPAIAERLPAGGVILADLELNNAPVHVTVVGPKNAVPATALFKAALSYPSSYKRLEWWDKREGAMPNPDVQYPELPRPAAFVCSNKRCSVPIFQAEEIHAVVDKINNTPRADLTGSPDR